MARMNISHRAKHFPQQLSGGQQQRVAIARAIAQAPPVILADEPTGNLDTETGRKIVELLKSICATGSAIMMTTHNLHLLSEYPGVVYRFENHHIKEVTHEYSRMEKEKMKTVIARGIHRAVWPGRMEILSTEPFLMVDGAHNSNGIHALRTSLEELYPEEKFHFVMGVMADKDYEKMIGELLPLAMDFVTVTPESARALQGETLAEDIRKQGVPAHAITKVAEIPELLTPKEKTIALGSLYFIGELKSVYQNRA